MYRGIYFGYTGGYDHIYEIGVFEVTEKYALKLDYSNIFEYTDVDIAYLFMDKIYINPGQNAKSVKLASMQDWYFKIHFPGDPMMPGIFIMEQIMVAGTFIIRSMPDKKASKVLMQSCNNACIYRAVRPGDILVAYVELISYKRGIAKFSGASYVDDNLVCKIEFVMVVPDDMNILDR